MSGTGIPEGWITSKEAAVLIGRKSARTRLLLQGMDPRTVTVGNVRSLIVRRDHPELVRLVEEEKRMTPPVNAVTLSELLRLTGKTRQQVEADVEEGQITRLGKFRSPSGGVVWYYPAPE